MARKIHENCVVDKCTPLAKMGIVLSLGGLVMCAAQVDLPGCVPAGVISDRHHQRHHELRCREPQPSGQSAVVSVDRCGARFGPRPERKGGVLPIGVLVSEVLAHYALQLDECSASS